MAAKKDVVVSARDGLVARLEEVQADLVAGRAELAALEGRLHLLRCVRDELSAVLAAPH